MAARASSVRRDIREAGKSFVAGGVYAAGVVMVGGLIAATVTQTVLPSLVDAVAPGMPRYTANEIARAERFNPDQWSFPETAQNVPAAPSLVAGADARAPVRLAKAD